MRHKDQDQSQTTVRDPRIVPYFIVKDDHGYTVNEEVTPKQSDNKNNKLYIKPVGHYSDFGGCLKSIAKLLTNTHKNYDSISEYLITYNKLKEEINQLVTLEI